MHINCNSVLLTKNVRDFNCPVEYDNANIYMDQWTLIVCFYKLPFNSPSNVLVRNNDFLMSMVLKLKSSNNELLVIITLYR